MGSLEVGHILAGRYRLVSPLGRGAMGEVWKAEHVTLGTPMAIKVIVDAEFGASNPRRAELVGRFFREAQAAASLRSPHVVQIFDHGDDGVPYIAMELLEGETLEARLERGGALSPQMTADVITQMARAVGKAHEAGIVHRDLKPGNVFLVRNDDQELVKVLDFGIAKVTDTALMEPREGLTTRTGAVVGTPCYMSPEQALGNKNIDFRADLWAMAIIAFECMVGRRPFDGDTLGVLIVEICTKPMPVPSAFAHVPEGFDAWFAKAASRDPEGRFPSPRAMAEALREVVGGNTLRLTQTSLVAITPPEPTAQLTHPGVVSAIAAPSGRRRVPALVAFAGMIVALVALGLVVAMRRSASPVAGPVALAPSAEARSAGVPLVSATAQAPEITPAQSAALPAPAATAPAAAVPDAPTASVSAQASAQAKPVSSGKPPLRVVGSKPSGSKPGGYRPSDHLGF